MKQIIKLLFLILVFSSCGNPSNNSSNSRSNYSSDSSYEYEDGTYCAEIEYYYSRTGTSSEYTLEVEIEDDELVKIYWSNGGWLDDSHFDPPDISDGSAEFSSDRGVDYEIEIIGEEGDCNLSHYSPSEASFISEAKKKLCPNCGGRKYSSDTYCDDCTDEIENTCSRCGGYEYFVNGGMCSSCTDRIENTCSRCGGHEYYVYGGLCSSCQDDDNDDW